VRITPHGQAPYPDINREALSKVVTQAFAQRRKTLRNNFKGIFSESNLKALSIDPGWRAERLQLEDFVNLTRLASERSSLRK